MNKKELSLAQTVAFCEESLLERKATFIKLWWVQGERHITITGSKKFNKIEALKTLGEGCTFIIKDEQF